MSIRTPGDGEPPVSGPEGIGEEAARALQTELLGYIDTSITKLILAQMTAGPMGRLPQEVQRKYAAALVYAKEKGPYRSAWPKMLEDFSSQDLASLLHTHEFALFEGSKELKNYFPDLAVPNFSPDLRGPDLPLVMATHRALEVSWGGWPNSDQMAATIDELESMVAADLQPKDLSTLLKIGQEGPPDYAPLVSKLLHSLSFPGVTIGEETKEKDSEGLELLTTAGEQMLEGTLAQKRLISRYGKPPSNVISEILGVYIRFIQNNAGRDLVLIWPQIYDQLLSKTIDRMVVIFGEAYFLRDGERVTPQALHELRQMIMHTAFLRNFGRKEGEVRLTLERVMKACVNEIGKMLGEEVKAEIEKGLPTEGSSLSSNAELQSQMLEDITGAASYVEQLLKIYSKPASEKRSSQRHQLMEQLATDPNSPMTTSPSVSKETTSWYAAFVSLTTISNQDRKKAVKILADLIGSTTDPETLRESAAILILAERKSTDINELIEKIFEKMASSPEYDINPLVRGFSYADEGKEIRSNFVFFQRFFSPSRLQRYPALASKFLVLLSEPGYRTFYNACSIAGFVLEHENFRGPFAEQFFSTLFASEAHFIDPLRLTILRNISERLPGTSVAGFFQRVIALPAFPSDTQAREKIFALVGKDRNGLQAVLLQQEHQAARAQDKVDRKVEKERKTKGPIRFLQSIKPEHFEPRDLQIIIQEIREHRTIQIGDSGHEESLHHVPSLLASILDKARIKRNRETGNPPDGLACNVTVFTKTDIALPCRVNVDGSLAIRLLDEHGSETGKTITRSTAAQYQIPELVFDELHFVVLECLKKIYVRKEAPAPTEQPAEVVTPAVIPPVVAAEAEEPPTPPTVEYVNGLPEVTEREEGPMHIDLTDSEKLKQRRLRTVERKRIETNLAAVERVFAPLVRRESLPAIVPAETKGLVLHMMDGKQFFKPVADPVQLYTDLRAGKIKPEEVYIRYSRAHVKSLPFVKKLRQLREDTASHPLWIVLKEHRSDLAKSKYDTFKRDEHGEAMELGNKPKILYFDTEDSPWHPLRRQLFERLKNGRDIPGQLQTKERELEQEMREIRENLRKQFLEGETPNLPEYLKQKLAAEKRALQEYDEFENVLKEISAKTQEIVEPVRDSDGPLGMGMRSRLRLPQAGFVFEQTFNQGGFKTLAEVLKLPSAAEGAPSQL